MNGSSSIPASRQNKKVTLDLNNSASSRSAQAITSALQNQGFDAFIAGGAVRDYLLGKTPKDFDVATSAHPKEILKCFKKTQKVGIAFGVVIVHDFEVPIEVATFREDGNYSDGRHPEQVKFSNAETDANRRDFTINGLFFDPSQSLILDYVDGLKDLEQKQIRAIRDPQQRFQEDYLRMLRAIRFSITLNFDIETKTFDALQQYSPLIQGIAPNRIHGELQRTLNSQRADLALTRLNQSTLLQTIFPESKINFPLEFSEYHEGGSLVSCFALLHHHLTNKKELEQKLDQLRCSVKEKKETVALSSSYPSFLKYNQLNLAEKKRLVRDLQTDEILYFISRLQLDAKLIKIIEQDLHKWKAKDLFPDYLPRGKELIAKGFKSGVQLGECLTYLEDEALNNHINSNQDAWNLLEKHPTFSKAFIR